jgi:hypothetical protein
MTITKVNPPRFKIGRKFINEYELRTLMIEVKKGLKPSGSIVTDEDGTKSVIGSDGLLSKEVIGLGLADKLALKLFFLQTNSTLADF